MKILIVEDNPGDVSLLREAFRELNSQATIVVARDGEECLNLLLGTSALTLSDLPDLVFLDLTLPVISGYEVLSRLKSDPKTRHIPIIVLSSVQAESEIARAYQSHANAYVRKPQTIEDLLAAARGLKSFWMETARLATSFAGN